MTDSEIYGIFLGKTFGKDLFRRFAANLDIDIGTEDIWAPGGTRVDPVAAGVVTISSTSASDSATGTGVRTLELTYIDAAGLEQVSQITMNGLTTVTPSFLALRIQRMQATSNGSTLAAVGNISCNIGGVLQNQIPATFNQTRTSHFYMPADKRGVVMHFVVGNTPGTVTFVVQTRTAATGWRERASIVSSVNSTAVPFPLLKLEPNEEIKITGNSIAVNQFSYAAYSVIRERITP